MKKKYINILFILNLFLIVSISLGTITRADLKLSTDDNINDSKGDVIVIDIAEKSWKRTSSHSELDVDTMVRSDQDFTIAFYNTISTSENYTYMFTIYTTFQGTGSYMVSFDEEEDGYLWGMEGFWTDSGWGSYFDAISVGSISGKNIEIGIPNEAVAIQSSHNWYFIATFPDYAENKSYADICPNSLESEMLKELSGPSGGGGISGYDLPILIGITATFSIIFIYVYKKQLKSRI